MPTPKDCHPGNFLPFRLAVENRDHGLALAVTIGSSGRTGRARIPRGGERLFRTCVTANNVTLKSLNQSRFPFIQRTASVVVGVKLDAAVLLLGDCGGTHVRVAWSMRFLQGAPMSAQTGQVNAPPTPSCVDTAAFRAGPSLLFPLNHRPIFSTHRRCLKAED